LKRNSGRPTSVTTTGKAAASARSDGRDSSPASGTAR
jgi:hypothetical protein